MRANEQKSSTLKSSARRFPSIPACVNKLSGSFAMLRRLDLSIFRRWPKVALKTISREFAEAGAIALGLRQSFNIAESTLGLGKNAEGGTPKSILAV